MEYGTNERYADIINVYQCCAFTLGNWKYGKARHWIWYDTFLFSAYLVNHLQKLSKNAIFNAVHLYSIKSKPTHVRLLY